ncbi:MAG TPA: glycosyltransferase family 39 protein [Chitinophagaceae bacterium]|nr:glycosyltransferase family 39 protein [Chitinophagaceae bacterium]
MLQPAAPDKPIIGLLAILKFLIPFLLIHPAFELQRDEYLYYQQGQHLDLGFLENPPLLSYLGYISSWFGNKEWLVRFWPAFIGALTVIVTCLIAARFGGKTFAQLLAGFGVITGAFLRIHILFQPNILDIFFWTSSLYFLVRFIQTNNRKDFFWLAICLALGWWSKYSVVFLITSILIGLLISRHRNVLFQKNTYKIFAVALLIISPNIWWQYSHKWPLIHHMQELRETQLIYVNPMDFIKDQFLLLFPVLIIWIAGLIWFMKHSTYRIFAWIYISVILVLIFGSGKSYYALSIYPLLLAAGSTAWEKLFSSGQWMRYIIAALVAGLTIPFVPIGLPMKSPEKLAAFYKEKGIGKTGLLKWEDQRDHELPMDFADMLGWKEIAEKAERFFTSLPDSVKNSSGIFGRHYGLAGSLKFYGKDETFRSKIFSDNGSFLLWIPDSLYFRHLLFIGRRMTDEEDEVFLHFERVTVVDSVTNKLSRQSGDKIIFFENIDPAGLKLAQDGLKQMKSGFNR